MAVVLTDPPSASAARVTWTLADWLRYQEQLHPRAIELGLERVCSVAQRLGLLEQVPVTLTIGGTNGKGSSAELAALILREAGHRVGLYTSPHLLRYNERVRIDGAEADDAALCAVFERIERARGDVPLTYFEFGTLAALTLFRESQVDVQVLEVGLGGRLDAVNIIDADAALVTNVGLDHMDWLGKDRESIGREKAGIYRAHRPSVCADPDPPPSLTGARWQLGRDFRVELQDRHWHWQGWARQLTDLPLPGLAGRFQLDNAAGVLALLQTLPELGVDAGHIRAALPRLRLAGRFQRAGRVIFDVAHNTEAAVALTQSLRQAGITGGVRWVLGMLADKPVEAFGRALAGLSSEAHVASLPGPRGLPAEQLAARLAASGLRPQIHADVPSALAAALAADAAATVVVTGSFLTVAAVAEQARG
jgi:dihydrofolate synthase / folylpolyglutamate synthase